MPVVDPATGDVLIDSLGRRSYTTSVAFGPTIGKNIALAYLPADYCEVGRKLNVEYFAESFRSRLQPWVTSRCMIRRI